MDELEEEHEQQPEKKISLMIEAIANGATNNYIRPIGHRLVQVIDKNLINTCDGLIEE